MRLAIALLAASSGFLPAASFGQAQVETDTTAIAGEWQGALATAPDKSILLVLHIGRSSAGWTAALDSPTQNAEGLAATSVSLNGADLRIEWTTPKANYVARLSADGLMLMGSWSQGKASLPLTFRRTDGPAPAALVRPQTPHPPYPYRSEEVAYENPAGPAHLAGTLTLPAGPGPFPAVLLITGSGLQDRDETLFGHKPFLLWADYLTRRGIAVLRVDDRQVGGSTGDVLNATTEDFAKDVEAGLVFLRSRTEIDRKHIGLMGHSEGGVIAPMVAARDPGVAFIVMLAGSGEPGEELLLQQKRLAEMAAGIPAAIVEQSVQNIRRLYDAVKDAPDQMTAEAALESAWRNLADGHGSAVKPMPPQTRKIASPWMRWFIRYDLRPTLARVHCPVLALNGSKDLQVAPEQNLAGIKEALTHNPDVTVVELPGLNHLFQTAGTGQVSEYGKIEETIAPIALSTVYEWISSRVPQAGIAK